MTRFDFPPAAPRPVSRRRPVLGACGLAVLLVTVAVGCNGDDESAPGTTAPPPTTATTVVTTTVPDPAPTTTPTTVADTDPPPTTVAETAPSTSTNADPEIQAVVDGLVAAWTAFNEIKLDPLNDEKLLVVAETHRGDLLDRVAEIVENLRAAGRRSIPNPEVPTEVVPMVNTVVVDGSDATMDYCWVNSNILVEVGGNDDGSDRVIDDSVTAVIQRETLELVDGRWVATGSEAVDRFPEVASCDDVI